MLRAFKSLHIARNAFRRPSPSLFVSSGCIPSNTFSQGGYSKRCLTTMRSMSFPLLTLRPEKLIEAGQPIVDASGLVTKTFTISSGASTSKRELGYMEIYFTYKDPFPPGTKGFLYYVLGSVPLGGRIRFRICDDASTFDQGQDLKLYTGDVWELSLFTLVQAVAVRAVTPLLLEDNLVDKELIDDIKKLPRHNVQRTSTHLYSLTDPFVIGLSKQNCLFCITRKNIAQVRMGFYIDTRRAFRRHPYCGSVLARFELSTFPEHARQGPTLVLKILKILSPITYTMEYYDGHIIRPREGSYYTRYHDGVEKIWNYPLKKKKARMESFGPLLRDSHPELFDAKGQLIAHTSGPD